MKTPWWRSLARAFPFLVPPLYLAVVLALQAPDRLCDPEPAWLGRLLYDDYDQTAMALRGLNAWRGRTPGRAQEPPFADAGLLSRERDGALPEARYFMEYPHAALLVFQFPYVLFPPEPQLRISPAVADANHRDVTEHVPRDEAERQLWRLFRKAITVYRLLMTACLLALMAVLHAGYEPGDHGRWPIFLLVLPGVLYFSLSRYDIVPALATTLALACLGRRWVVPSAVCLATATMLKVYPVLLAPLVFHYLNHDRRQAIAWAGAYAAMVLVFLAVPLLAWDWTATVAPYRFQLGRPPEFGWTAYGRVIPRFLGENNPLGSAFRLGSVVATVALLCWRPIPDLTALLRRGTVVLIVFVTVQVFYSPQWIVWLVPLLVPLAGRSKAVLWLTAALDLVTFLSFPVIYDQDRLVFQVIGGCLVFARTFILAALAALLVRYEFRNLHSVEAAGSRN